MLWFPITPTCISFATKTWHYNSFLNLLFIRVFTKISHWFCFWFNPGKKKRRSRTQTLFTILQLPTPFYILLCKLLEINICYFIAEYYPHTLPNLVNFFVHTWYGMLLYLHLFLIGKIVLMHTHVLHQFHILFATIQPRNKC